MHIDRLDADLIELLTESPMLPVMECARRLGVARGTITSRLARLHDGGVIKAIIPQVQPAGFDYQLVAFCSVEIIQKFGHEPVASALAESIPEIVDMYTVTGNSDLQLRVVARNAGDLQAIFDRINQVPGWLALPPHWRYESIFRAAPCHWLKPMQKIRHWMKRLCRSISKEDHRGPNGIQRAQPFADRLHHVIALTYSRFL